MIPKQIPATSEQIDELCRRWHVRRLSFFGSVLDDDFRPESDVDVLVEFVPGQTPGLEVYDFEQELSALCGGRRIDRVNPRYLNRWIKDTVLRTALTAYVQG
ncbi:MAG: nucleotidyltransferase domain-containing protein [Nitrococcus sp.]|nr:nucleotidyltransferase domain-containing protein [Nitrococcus sp.]